MQAALAKVAEWGDEATLRARVRRLNRQKIVLTFILPAVCLLALVALTSVMKTRPYALDPQRSGFAWFMLMAMAGGSHLMGMGHEGGWRWSHMSQSWKDSGNWAFTMCSPGARTVYAAILAQCEEACYMHLYMLEDVSRAEQEAGVCHFNPLTPCKQAYIKVTYQDGGYCICDPKEMPDMIVGAEGYTTEVVLMSKKEFEALPEFQG